MDSTKKKDPIKKRTPFYYYVHDEDYEQKKHLVIPKLIGTQEPITKIPFYHSHKKPSNLYFKWMIAKSILVSLIAYLIILFYIISYPVTAYFEGFYRFITDDVLINNVRYFHYVNLIGFWLLLFISISYLFIELVIF